MSQQLKVHENESDIRYVTFWWFDCGSIEDICDMSFSCTIYVIVRLNDFIHLLNFPNFLDGSFVPSQLRYMQT